MRQERWSEKYPGPGTSPLPTEPCISEERFALEGDRVFRRSWLQVGRVEEIPHAGEYFKCVIRDTLQESTAARESVHAGIASRVRSHLVLPDDELPIRHFHQVPGDHAGYGRCA